MPIIAPAEKQIPCGQGEPGLGVTDAVVAALRKVWNWLREVSGDDAYERYVKIQSSTSCDKPLTEAEYYRQRLERKYAQPSRCC